MNEFPAWIPPVLYRILAGKEDTNTGLTFRQICDLVAICYLGEAEERLSFVICMCLGQRLISKGGS